MIKIKPFNVFDCRRVDYCPPYFESDHFNIRHGRDRIVNSWIVENLSGRYYIDRSITLDNNQNIDQQIKIGFEDKKDMSYFLLACSVLSS